jgi:hypothetical protein
LRRRQTVDRAVRDMGDTPKWVTDISTPFGLCSQARAVVRDGWTTG